MLNARQFGLKLIANVTYGYAAAGFSGRMPMAELADAIVQVTLEDQNHAQCFMGMSSSLADPTFFECLLCLWQKKNVSSIVFLIEQSSLGKCL